MPSVTYLNNISITNSPKIQNTMKKFWHYIAVCAVAATMAPLTSCDDDDTVDPYDINYCYLYQPNSTFARLEYKANGEFLIDINDPLALKPVRLTKPAPRDLSVKVGIDPSLVDEYNQANNTEYTFLEGASIVNPVLHIPAGQYISTEVISVSFGDKKGFQTENENLILPITITDADGQTISKSSRIFLTFSSTYKANKVVAKHEAAITVDTDVDGWQSAYSTLTISDILTADWNADDPITVSAVIDNSLIDAYNQANASSYQSIQASLANSEVVIPAGSSKGAITLNVGDYTGVANGSEYIIPVKFTFTSGVGAELTTDVSYITISNLPLELTRTAVMPSGYTQIAYEDSWTGSIDGNDTDFAANVLADSDNTGSYVFADPGSKILVDLGSAKTVHMMAVSFFQWFYGASDLLDVETSADGNAWTKWGNVDVYGNQTYYISFSKPATFRYIRWTDGDYSYPTYGMIAHTGIKFYNK